MPITLTDGNHNSWATEYFLAAASTTASYQTTDTILQVFIDANANGTEEARARLAHWRSVDPPSSFLGTRRSFSAPRTRRCGHTLSDPERVLELAVDYMALGLWDDAHALLARRFPATGVVAEPGTALPQDYPLVAYSRGYCAERAGRSGGKDFAHASGQSTRYVFPNRPESLVVLRRATEANPEDATAHFLLGSFLLSGGQADAALAEWERARALDPRLPVLHRNIGFTHLYARGAAPEALRAFECILQGAPACGGGRVRGLRARQRKREALKPERSRRPWAGGGTTPPWRAAPG